MEERRKFERLVLPKAAKVHMEDEAGKRIGRVKVLSRGGMLLESERRQFNIGTTHTLVLVDSSQGIYRPLRCLVRNKSARGIGIEFQHLEADGAVELGIVIAKYYSQRA